MLTCGGRGQEVLEDGGVFGVAAECFSKVSLVPSTGELNPLGTIAVQRAVIAARFR